jgi:hypothetical protein
MSEHDTRRNCMSGPGLVPELQRRIAELENQKELAFNICHRHQARIVELEAREKRVREAWAALRPLLVASQYPSTIPAMNAALDGEG